MEEPIRNLRRNDWIAKHVAPRGKALIVGQENGPFL
jgi:hypothetical protein